MILPLCVNTIVIIMMAPRVTTMNTVTLDIFVLVIGVILLVRTVTLPFIALLARSLVRSTACTPLQIGSPGEYPNGAGACQDCQQNYYCLGGSSSSIECLNGQTASTGSSSVLDCYCKSCFISAHIRSFQFINVQIHTCR
jgi:hypothetical protein